MKSPGFAKRTLQPLTRAARLVTSPWRTLPDFFIAGTQKGGTSSLYSYLVQHPAIESARTKEVHFFERPMNRKKGVGWYRSHFPLQRDIDRKSASSGGSVLTGEATPAMYSFHFPRHLHEICPDIKLIFLLREPGERAFSHYHHNRRRPGREALTFGEAIRQESSRIDADLKKSREDEWHDDELNRMYSYLHRGLYAEQLDNWLRLFSIDQIYVAESERFFSDAKAVISEIAAFLEVDAFEFNVDYRTNVGTHKTAIEPGDRAFLDEYYAEPNRQLATLLCREFWAAQDWP